ncbi:aquaporin AQPcic-like [Schistocerca piceifrons]|uniref:aquaporin AQPcic-like n=1 Tax=Schistocerca piceifrons TaxID=274613 RepID=UPI001F5E4F07|nr:aquaporin AQPcic-like [Schistocerca piceifrons]
MWKLAGHTLGYVSGAHVNPAVTVGLVVGGFLGPLKALLYVTAQCVGATAGSFVLQALTPNETVATLGVNALNRHVTPTQGCFVEMVISFVLVMAVYSAATGGAAAAAAGPFTVGMSITACHLFAALTPEESESTLGVTTVSPHLTLTQAVFVEAFITFFLMMTVFGARSARGSAGFAIGLSITTCHLFAGQPYKGNGRAYRPVTPESN